MPVRVQWDNQEKTIIRQIYSGDLKLDDYFQAVDDFVALATSVNHVVHSIMDRREVASSPQNTMRALRYGNEKMPPNVGLRVIINPSLFTRIMVDVGKRLAPNLVKNVYYVQSLEEAHQTIDEVLDTAS